MEYDYSLHDELEDAYEYETPLHAELIHTMIPYEETAEEKEVVQRTWTLDRVPASLEKQFSDYKDWRLSPLNFQRQGNAVVDTTAQSDCGTTQRFLAYCQAEHGIAPTLATFGTAQLATLAQSWLEKLSERGLMWSTLGNYCNSLCVRACDIVLLCSAAVCVASHHGVYGDLVCRTWPPTGGAATVRWRRPRSRWRCSRPTVSFAFAPSASRRASSSSCTPRSRTTGWR